MAIDKSQLDVAMKMNSLMESLGDNFERMNDLGSKQTKVMSDVADSSRLVAENFDLINSEAAKLNKTSFDYVLDELTKTRNHTAALKNAFKFLDEHLERKSPKSFAIARNALSGLSQGMKNLGAGMRSVTGLAASFAGGFVRVAASIASIPFRILNYFIETAADAGGGSNELAQAIENLRKEFGYLTGPSPQAIMKMGTALNGFADTGLNAFQIFGDLAKRLTDFLELAKEMGPSFQLFIKEFSDNGGALLAYQKGLGLTGEQMKSVANIAASQGDTFASSLKEITKYSLDMAKSFGIDGKLISRDMAKAMGDVKHFAGATTKAIAESTVYARKFGVELEKITGTLDQFETFDTAAESAAKLSQAFGVQVDAFKLMEAQDPADQINQLRKSMSAAGVDASNFNRQQLKLLASTTGLDEATTRQVFSQKNQGVSLDEIKKKSAESEKKTLTQAESMGKLADAIERLVQSGGGGGSASFFDRFIHGFIGGIQVSQEFRSVMMNINRALIVVERAGVRLGVEFVKIFPGVHDFLTGLADLFSPAKFSKLANGVTDVFISWFKDLSTGNASFSGLMDGLKSKFFDFFNVETSAGRKTIMAFKKIFQTIVKVIAEGVKWGAEQMKGFLTWLNNVIKNPSELIAQGKSGAGGFAGFIAETFTPLYEAFADAGHKLIPVLGTLFETVFNKLYELIKDIWSKHWVKISLAIGSIIAGPMLTKVLFTHLTTGLVKKVGGAVSEFMSSGTAAKAMTEASKIPSTGGPELNQALKNAPDAGGVEKAAKSTEALSKAGNVRVNWADVGKFLVGFAGMMLIGMGAFAGTIGIIRILEANREEIVNAMLIMGSIATSVLFIAPAMYLLNNMKVDWKNLGIGLAAMAVTMIAVGALGAAMVYFLGSFEINKIVASALVMTTFSGVFGIMGLLLVEMTAVGAIVATGYGGGAMLLGFAAVTAGVLAVAATANQLVKILSKMETSQGLQVKLSMFESVMKVLADFTSVFVALSGQMQSDWMTLFTGQDYSTKVNSFGKLLDKVIGTNNSGLTGILHTVVKLIADLGSSDRMASGAKILAESLTAVTSLVQALLPSKDFFDSSRDWLPSLTGLATGGGMDKIAKGVSLYVDKTTSSINTVMDKLKFFISETQTSFKDVTPEKAATISQVISSMASILKAAMPSQDQMANFKTVQKTSVGLAGYSNEISTFDSVGLTTFLNTVFNKVKDTVPVLMGSVLSSLKGLTIPAESIKTVEVVMSTIGDVLSISGKILETVNNFNTKGNGQDTTSGAMIAAASGIAKKLSASQEIGSIFDVIKTNMPQLIESIKDAVSGIKPEQIKTNLDIAMKLIDAVKLVTDIASSVSKLGTTNGAVGVSATDALNASFTSLGNMFSRGGAFKTLLNAFGNFSVDTGFAELIKTNSANIKSMFGMILGSVKDITTEFSADKITSGGLTPAINAIKDIVNATQELDDALSKMGPVNLKAKLTKYASAAGLGGKAVYTVESKAINLTVNLHVQMDATELEHIMITKKTSVIRDRFNFLGKKGAINEPQYPLLTGGPANLVNNAEG